MADGADRSNTRAMVVIAITGLLSTLGAAFLGGALANQAVETQVYVTRDFAIKDQRRTIYVDYLRATSKVCQLIGAGDVEGTNAAAVELLNQQGRVLLIAGEHTRNAVDNFSNQLLAGETAASSVSDPCNLAVYRQLRDAFITAAEADLR